MAASLMAASLMMTTSLMAAHLMHHAFATLMITLIFAARVLGGGVCVVRRHPETLTWLFAWAWNRRG
jgi:hypothetical protein